MGSGDALIDPGKAGNTSTSARGAVRLRTLCMVWVDDGTSGPLKVR